MRNCFVKTSAVLALALAVTACGHLPDPMGLVDRGTNRAANRAVDTAADKTGQAVGDRMGTAFAGYFTGQMTPMLTQFWMTYVFALAFNQGGYAVNETPYKPGEWTRWSIPNKDADKDAPKELLLERAYLFDDKDGNQWWKVKFVGDPNKPADSTMIVEALFDKANYTLLRMRSKMPNEKEGKEVPVTQATYYVPPQQLTKQSLEGATKGVETVVVPAGTFRAKHVVFSDGAGGTAEWFLADRIPGGNVKFVSTGPKSGEEGAPDPENYVMNLVTHGKGAQSELGIAK